MGPINWVGVILAAIGMTAVLLAIARSKATSALWMLPLALVSSAMLGHALARIGAEKLAAKPQLFFMQSGGLALAFVIPALFISQARHGVSLRQTAIDGAAFLAAYLAMGAVFWALA